jgi:hypothetical protein
MNSPFMKQSPMGTVLDYTAITEGGIVRLTWLAFAVFFVTANVWAEGPSAPCAGAKQACKAAREAKNNAKQKYDSFRGQESVNYAALLVAEMQFDRAWDAFAACMEVFDNCDAEAKAESRARSKYDAAHDKWVQEQLDEVKAKIAYDEATKACDDKCKAYLDCLQKNPKPKTQPKTPPQPRAKV